MEGVYPIVLDGELSGKLKIRQEGRRTVFSTECRPREGVVRISVYGGGREGYLGVLVPADGLLRLEKTLSPAALRGFPDKIESVERSGLQMQAAPPEPESSPEPQEEFVPPLPEADTEEIYWYSSPDGALVRFDGTQNLLALPIGDARLPSEGGRPCCIDGRDYLVFRTKNGRLIP